MGKGFVSSTRSYAKNLATHVRHLLTRRETAKEAFIRIKNDSKKLKHALGGSDSGDGHKKAVELVKKGQARYNAGDYEKAEQYFQHALTEDPQYGWALTYLGHTYYQMQRIQEATSAWQRAYYLDPSSTAGLKAMKKLRHVTQAGDEVVQALKERLER